MCLGSRDLCLKSGLSDASWGINTDTTFSSLRGVCNIFIHGHPLRTHQCWVQHIAFAVFFFCLFFTASFPKVYENLLYCNLYISVKTEKQWKIMLLGGTNRPMNSCIYRQIFWGNRLKNVFATCLHWVKCLCWTCFPPNAARFNNHLKGINCKYKWITKKFSRYIYFKILFYFFKWSHKRKYLGSLWV